MALNNHKPDTSEYYRRDAVLALDASGVTDSGYTAERLMRKAMIYAVLAVSAPSETDDE